MEAASQTLDENAMPAGEPSNAHSALQLDAVLARTIMNELDLVGKRAKDGSGRGSATNRHRHHVGHFWPFLGKNGDDSHRIRGSRGSDGLIDNDSLKSAGIQQGIMTFTVGFEEDPSSCIKRLFEMQEVPTMFAKEWASVRDKLDEVRTVRSWREETEG